MTFSAETRQELARIVPSKRCCARSELAAVLRAERAPRAAGGPFVLALSNPTLARKVYLLIKAIDPEAPVEVEQSRAGRRRMYTVRAERGREIFDAAAQALGGDLDSDRPPARRCCRRAYLRGAYVCAGSVAAPSKTYHFEVVVDTKAFAQSLQQCLASLGLEARITLRKQAHVIYLKDSDHIVEALSLMGAHQALLELENVRIVKEMRNQANRLVNCETANVDKTVNAALAQVNAIEALRDTVGLEALPAPLRALARARLENPYASLRELGEMMSPRVGKSGVSYRMKRIMALAEAAAKGREPRAT